MLADYGQVFLVPSRTSRSHAMVAGCADLVDALVVNLVPDSVLYLLDHDLIPCVLHADRKAGSVEEGIPLVLGGCHHAYLMEHGHAAGCLSNLSNSLDAAGADSECGHQDASVLDPGARVDEVNLEVAGED